MEQNYLYKQIYEDIKSDIESGLLKVGEKIPTEAVLMDKYGVSRIVPQKSIKMLVNEGYVRRKSGAGTFVIEREEENLDIFEINNKKKSLGFILEALWSSYGVGLFDGAYDRAEERGYNLILKKSHGCQAKETEEISDLINLGVDGIILMPIHGEFYSEKLLKLVVDKFPVVFIDRYLEGINVPLIGTDNIKASKEAVNYLIKMGHKNIGIVTSRDGEASTLDERKKGYIDAYIENDLSLKRNHIFDVLISYPTEADAKDYFETYISKIEEYLIENKEITAIFTVEYDIANLIKIAATRLNKSIPEDLEIVCFDQPNKLIGDYEFTFVEQQQKAMGRLAVDVLIDVIEGKTVKKKTLLEAKLVKGNSTK